MSDVPDISKPVPDQPTTAEPSAPPSDSAAPPSDPPASPSERAVPAPSTGSAVPTVQGPADLRCSDVDRERVAEALRKAAGDGRLTLTELEERLEAAFRARTYGDLQPITRDLPQGPYPMPGGTHQWQNRAGSTNPPLRQAASGPASGGPVRPQERITSVLGSDKRAGRWEVPARLDVLSVLGEVVLDFTEAIVRTREIEIQAGVILGSLTLIVPEGIDVRFEQGGNFLGERKMKLRSAVTPGSPVYHIRGFTVLGEITVRPPKSQRRSISGL